MSILNFFCVIHFIELNVIYLLLNVFDVSVCQYPVMCSRHTKEIILRIVIGMR